MPFRIALSGLNAASTDLEVTANNIANTSTTGFKGSRAEFADLFAAALQGVSANAERQRRARSPTWRSSSAQGNIETHRQQPRPRDQRPGLLHPARRRRYSYTRAGAFQINRDGYVANSSGQRLQVYPPLANGTLQHRRARRPAAARPQNRRQATGDGADGAQPARPTPRRPRRRRSIRNDPNSYNQATLAHAVRLAGRHAHRHACTSSRRRPPTQWTREPVHRRHRRRRVAARCSIRTRGALTTPAGGQLAVPGLHAGHGRGRHEHHGRHVGKATQYGNTFAVNSVTQDGYHHRPLIGIDIDRPASCRRASPTASRTPLGQVAIANFANPQGLQQLGNTQLGRRRSRSGQAMRGAGRQSGFGIVQSGALEGVERRPHRAAGQHDHRAAQLPGERADDHDRRPDDPDHHQHPQLSALTARRGVTIPWIVCSTSR